MAPNPLVTLISACVLAVAGLWPLASLAAPPVIVDPLSTENGAPRVAAQIPVSKTLVLPLAASDPEGEIISFTVRSSNAKILARVRTGCPILKVRVSYVGSGTTAAFTGDLEFQLFRDVTPVTSGIIGGAAQAGFYDNLIFHRVIPDFIIQGGDPAGTGSGNPGFTFQHEFRPELIFTGRGQLAMANSNGGYDRGRELATGSGLVSLGSFVATNGSQFFVTTDQPRPLDFKHTIFGQLLRGFDLLDKISLVPRDANDKPTVPVKMDVVSVTPGRSDATLLLSATGPGASTLTVTATDPSGERAVRTIAVRAVKDTFNDPPVPLPIPNLLSAVGVAPGLTTNAFDLEHDYLIYGLAAVTQDGVNFGTSESSLGYPQITTNFSPRSSAGFQNLAVGVTALNDPLRGAAQTAGNPFAPFDAYRFQVAEIAYGDRAISSTPVTVEGVAATALTDVLIAEFRDADAADVPADFTATVNWGDGSAQDQSIVTTPKIRIERSATTPGAFVVKGTHTYARAGVFPIEVVVDSLFGATDRTLGQAVISAAGASLRAVGLEMSNAGAALRERVLATFTDSTAGLGAGSFAARIDWGDGVTSPGTIVANGAGRFAVQGSHLYRDPETFAVNVHIARTATPAAQAVAWSRVTASGFRAPRHLPPFPAPHLVGELSVARDAAGNQQLFKQTVGTGANSLTRFAVSLVIFNSGNEISPKGTLRFYLSADRTFSPGTDLPMKIGTFTEGNIPAIRPNAAVSFDLGRGLGSDGKVQDFRLIAPRGNTGSGFFILARLGYSDALADQLPITKDVTFGRINGISVMPRTLTVTEADGAAHSGTFTVSLDRQPAADVRLAITPATTGEIQVSTALLTFTPANWNAPQTVTVTAIDDILDDNDKTTEVTIGPAESTDPAWSGMSGGTVSVTSKDNE